MRKARAIVGVDCGEQRHRFVMIDENGERVASYWVENELGKIFQAFDELGSLSETAKLEVVTESIGSLGAMVSQAVRGRGDELFLVSTKALRHYRDLEGQPHKSDDRDAYLAARMQLFGMEGVKVPPLCIVVEWCLKVPGIRSARKPRLTRAARGLPESARYHNEEPGRRGERWRLSPRSGRVRRPECTIADGSRVDPGGSPPG